MQLMEHWKEEELVQQVLESWRHVLLVEHWMDDELK
jgi:hypothetical protein